MLKCLRMLTFLPIEQIDEMDKWEGAQLNEAKEILAYELTMLVHDEAETVKAQEASRALFSSGGDLSSIPTTALTESDLSDGGVDILTLLVKSGLCPSKSEARRAVQQGGVEAGGEKVTDIAHLFTAELLSGEGLVLRRGKKAFNRVALK